MPSFPSLRSTVRGEGATEKGQLAAFPTSTILTIEDGDQKCSGIQFTGMELDPGSPLSLYVQLADALTGQIEAGTYRSGDRIPSVRKLRVQYGVSLTTVLEACRVLEDRGLVEAKAQSGHYVRRRQPSLRPEPDESKPPDEARRVDASLAVKLNLGIGNPQEPTLGAAVQGPELMAIGALNRLLGHVLRHQPKACHSYDAPPGSAVLRRSIAQRGTDAGYAVTADDIVITSGAKEAVYLSLKAVTRAGDTVAIESPAYYALLEVLGSLELKALEISSHPRHGINLDDLARAVRSRPVAAVALVSNFSNPTGSCMSDGAKKQLVDLLDVHDVPLIEDDVYGELVYEGPRPSGHQGLRPARRRPLLLVVQQDAVARSAGRVGHSRSLPEPGRAAQAGGEPGHRRRPPAGPGRLPRQRRLRPAHPAGPADVPGPDGVDDRRRGALLPGDDPADETAGGPRPVAAAPRRGGRPGALPGRRRRGIRIAPGPMFSPADGYRNFIRLNTGFPWNETTEQQMETLGRLVAERSASSAPRYDVSEVGGTL